MSTNVGSIAILAPELASTMNGTWKSIGTLIASPVQIIFDNQGNVDVGISTNGGTTTWRTFPGGEAVILDMRANSGTNPNFTFPIGTVFSGNGASGVFSISYTYVG